MKPVISMGLWLGLCTETRNYLRKRFHIGKSGGIEVCDGQIISDGTTEEDLSVLTVEAMQEFLNSKEKDIFELFRQVVELVEAPPVLFVKDHPEIRPADLIAGGITPFEEPAQELKEGVLTNKKRNAKTKKSK